MTMTGDDPYLEISRLGRAVKTYEHHHTCYTEQHHHTYHTHDSGAIFLMTMAHTFRHRCQTPSRHQLIQAGLFLPALLAVAHCATPAPATQ